MAQIDVGGAIGAGFGLIRRRPLSVLAWGLLPVLVQATAFALIAPLFLHTLAQLPFEATSAVPSVGSPGPGQILMAQGAIQLLNLVQLLLSAMIACAVWRAVLRPERSSFAYLRIGAAELFYVLLLFGLGIVLGMVLAILAIPALIVGAVAGLATHNVAVGIAAGAVVFFVIVIVLAVFVGLRLALIGPMIVADGKFHFQESWTATRGHLGELFLVALGLAGVLILAEIVVAAIFGGLGAAMIMSMGGFPAFFAQVQAAPGPTLMKLWPLLAAAVVVGIPLAGCARAIAGAPWAKVLQDLTADGSQTFA